MLTAERVVALLGLEPLPEEGGEFRVTYRSPEELPRMALPTRYSGPRALGGAIYYLLREGSFSALHRLHGDEIYHFYLGRPVELLLLHSGSQVLPQAGGQDGRGELVMLGTDLAAGQRPQVVVPAGVWQGSRLAPASSSAVEGDAYDFALLGTTMAPAYDPADFELAQPQDRAHLLAAYPECADLIRALTR